MPSPFVQHALNLWDAIMADSRTIPEDPSVGLGSITYTATPQGVTHDNMGSFYHEQRTVAFGGAPTIAALGRIKANLSALQAHFQPYPLLGADRLDCALYRDTPRLRLGPWAKFAFHLDSEAAMSSFVASAAALAEADGTGTGQQVRLNHNRASTIPVVANDRHNAYAMFALCVENLHIFRFTDTTDSHGGLTVPVCQPCALPDALWTNLWEAVQDARATGVRWGMVNLWPQPGGVVADFAATDLSKKLQKAIGVTAIAHQDLHRQTPQVQTAYTALLAPKMEAVAAAVLALHAESRARAPILSALDSWCIPVDIPSLPHYYAQDSFKWGPKSHSLKLLGNGSIWGDSHPVQTCNEVRFRYVFERALGVLATFTKMPTRAWLAPNGALLPGDTVDEAALLSVALASGNKPGFVPGAPLRAKDVSSAPWTLVQRAD